MAERPRPRPGRASPAGPPPSGNDEPRGAPAAGPECDGAEIVRARLLIEAGRPHEALAAAERLSRSLTGGGRGWALAAQAREVRGEARAALLDADGALDDFEHAEALWSRIGTTDGVCGTWVRGAMLQLRGLGNLHEAELRLDQARRAQGPRGSETWTRLTLARADLAHLRGRSRDAVELVEGAAAALQDPGRPAHALAAVAVQGLAVSSGAAQDRFARLLCDQLARVTPPPDRLALLAGIERCTPPRTRSSPPRRRAL